MANIVRLSEPKSGRQIIKLMVIRVYCKKKMGFYHILMGTHWNILRQWVNCFFYILKITLIIWFEKEAIGGLVEKQRNWFEGYGRSQMRDDLVGMRVLAVDPGKTLSFGAHGCGTHWDCLDDCCCSVAKSCSILCSSMDGSVPTYPSPPPGDDDRLQTQSRACSFTQWFSCFQDPMLCLFFQKSY